MAVTCTGPGGEIRVSELGPWPAAEFGLHTPWEPHEPMTHPSPLFRVENKHWNHLFHKLRYPSLGRDGASLPPATAPLQSPVFRSSSQELKCRSKTRSSRSLGSRSSSIRTICSPRKPQPPVTRYTNVGTCAESAIPAVGREFSSLELPDGTCSHCVFFLEGISSRWEQCG